jgi:hypothetical protein
MNSNHRNTTQKHVGFYFRYLAIGCISTFASYAIFIFLVFLNFDIVLASFTGMTIGVLNTYLLSLKYIAGDRACFSWAKLTIFSLYYGSAIYVTSFSIDLLIQELNFITSFAWLICNVIASICNYVFIAQITLPK